MKTKLALGLVLISATTLAQTGPPLKISVSGNLLKISSTDTSMMGYFSVLVSTNLTRWKPTGFIGSIEEDGSDYVMSFNWSARGDRFGPHEFFQIEWVSPLVRIRRQPDSLITINEGEALSLPVEANGPIPLTYAWWKGTEKIVGRERVLKIESVSQSDSGNYRAVVQFVGHQFARAVTHTVTVNVVAKEPRK